jgi:tetratricopeptide (TPR) repeat protein
VTGDSEAPRALILHGLGGCGKSAIALEVAYYAAESGVQVWWVEATDTGIFEAGMHAVARDTGAADEALRRGDASDVLWRMLRQYPSRWLLVVDNAEDLSVLTVAGRPIAEGRGWIRPPNPHRGVVLVTSRVGDPQEWGAWATLYPVDVLSTPDAAQVLIDHAGTEAGPVKDAESLAARLAGLPLALRLAGTYLYRSSTSPWRGSVASFATYLRAYDISARAGPTEPPLTSIDHAWDMLLEVLDRRQPPYARRLLWLLSILADAPIPYQLLLAPAELARSPLFPNLDGPQLWDLLLALADLGLVDLQHPVPGDGDRLPQLRMHQLVRDAARRQARQGGELGTCLGIAANLVNRTAKGLADPTDPADWPKWFLLAPHAFAVLRAGTTESSLASSADYADYADAADAVELSAIYLQSAGHYVRAENRLRLVLQARLRVADPDHATVLGSRHQLACVLHDLGRYEEAQAEHETVLHARQRSLGQAHRETLVSQHHIADLLSHRGREIEAEVECRAVLAARLKIRGPLDTDTLDSRHQLCYILRRQGRLAEAEAEYRVVLQLRQQQLGDEDHKTLATRFQLADVLHRQGRLAEARKHYEAVLAVRRRTFGDRHPVTLLAWHGLAVLLHQQGEIAASLEAHEEIHRRAVEMFGADDRRAVFIREPIEHLRAAACHGTCGTPESIATMRRLIDIISF